MYNEKLCKKYRKNFIGVHLIMVLVLSLVEVISYIISVRSSNPEISDYLFKGVLLPIFLNVVVHIGVKAICKLPELHYHIKDYAVTYAILITSAVAAFTHMEYPVASLVFVIPVMMPVIFNNKKLLTHALTFSLVVVSITTVVTLRGDKLCTAKFLVYSLMYLIILVCALISNINIGFLRESFRDVEKQSIEKTRINHMLKYDPMTGLYNRQAFFEHLNSFIADYNSKGENFSLAVLDMDDFKEINESYGHDAADEVLVTLAQYLRRHKTRADKVFRYGGEVFAFLIKTEDPAQAEEIIHNVKKDFDDAKFENIPTAVTFSCGIATYDGNLSAQDLFDKANETMRRAKGLGKDVIIKA